ncbi:carbamoyl-phosphate synthase large subunit [Pedobacter nanyangensis]|uniref:carbamoyl-phosphate synthase large subunit n=1 Tax=Pedobacter nanyangensis TaxID=1562389 RepID=UPI000DE48402|nr:carbamoyl-phosphate synthase large subunit [Pedobacter nanyangensis]
MPKDTSINSVLIIGSGPIIIGQACEFDYSGSQAALSLKEEGVKVSIINSNPATIMTDKVIGDHVYLKPLTLESIDEILTEHKNNPNLPTIDAVLPTMGGQTALNLCVDAEERGLWKKHNVRIIGVDVAAIDKTENRESFRQLMVDIGVGVATSKIANSFLEGKEAAQEIGFPLVIRPSYTLGGYGGGFVHKKEEFDAALKRGLEASPTHEVLVEQAVLGWKEYELELLRDSNDNVIIICSIENFDPMGIHTGDSITVAPAMTLSDRCYQEMRNQAIKMMRAIGNFAGGCNVQFSVNPDNDEIIAIEINPRVSRSSALASKATGYPIAKIAAKLAIGYNLDEIENQITKTTSAYFEPTLDYVIVKIPRFNFDKFKGANMELGLQMKAVGEVMGIGRSFNEALQKACQSLEIGRAGIGSDGRQKRDIEEIMHGLQHPSWNRVFLIKDAMSMGVPLESIRKATKIDKWFLNQIQELVTLETELKRYSLNNIPRDFFFNLKQKGFSDIQIAFILGNVTEDDVYNRRKELNIRRAYKMVDTCAAEFAAQTPYFYSTFEEAPQQISLVTGEILSDGDELGTNESIVSDKKKVIVLGSGPNRIGQGIEFDYSCVHGLLAAKENNFEAIMINCNPETVSTDFNMANKLYFEPVFWEHVREIIDLENPIGVIVQLGGQTALKMAQKLHENNIRIIGTSYEDMDIAEDRGSFSDLLKELDIPYPKYGVAENAEEAIKVANEVGYPVLVRPSYVLGGQGMSIVINDEDLESAVVKLLGDLPGNRVLIDHFLDRAEETESDSICDGEDVHIVGLMEHIEPAGIHSGDSSAVLPPFSLSDKVIADMENYSKKIAKALNVIGLLNIQFAVKDDKVYVIEANPRASRTVPFIAKAYDVPYINIAARIMLGVNKLKDFNIERKLQGYAIKEPVFSYNKFPEVAKELGPEMKSTGEAIRFIKDLEDPYFLQLVKDKSMYLSK